MVSVRLSIDEHGKRRHVESDDGIRQVLAHPGTLTWLDVDRDNLVALEPFADVIRLHPLAMEDAASPRQRPIFHRYNGTLFLVLYELIPPENGRAIRANPISFFVGDNYVITVRDIEQSTLDDVASRWQQFEEDENVEHPTSTFLLYAIVDALVDNYFPVLESLGDRMEELETTILASRDIETQRNVHQFRKQLLEIRRVLAPGREVLNELIRRDSPLMNDQTINYFHDVYDHVLRVLDTLDSYREMAGTLFEMQASLASYRLDEVLRTMTVASLMLMASALIAGIYGMNFNHMPELSWKLGYPMALGLMLASTGILYLIFKRRGWL